MFRRAGRTGDWKGVSESERWHLLLIEVNYDVLFRAELELELLRGDVHDVALLALGGGVGLHADSESDYTLTRRPCLRVGDSGQVFGGHVRKNRKIHNQNLISRFAGEPRKIRFRKNESVKRPAIRGPQDNVQPGSR